MIHDNGRCDLKQMSRGRGSTPQVQKSLDVAVAVHSHLSVDLSGASASPSCKASPKNKEEMRMKKTHDIQNTADIRVRMSRMIATIVAIVTAMFLVFGYGDRIYSSA